MIRTGFRMNDLLVLPAYMVVVDLAKDLAEPHHHCIRIPRLYGYSVVIEQYGVLRRAHLDV